MLESSWTKRQGTKGGRRCSLPRGDSLKTKIVGVSTDDRESHEKFAKKYSLPFPLLSDKDAVVAKSYGSAFKIGPFTMAKRHTFIISPVGKIAMIYRKVDPSNHSEEIVEKLKLLTIKK